MKAHTNLVLALLISTCCCLSSYVFCADVQKKLNRKERMELLSTYNDLSDQKNHTLDDYQKMEGLARKLKESEKALLDKDQSERFREDRVRQWHARELLAKNNIIIETLKNTALSSEKKIECLQKQHHITHALKIIYKEEVAVNPHNTKAQEEVQKFMAQSLMLGQYESLLPQQTTQSNQSEPKSQQAPAPQSKQSTVAISVTAQTCDQSEPAITIKFEPDETSSLKDSCYIL